MTHKLAHTPEVHEEPDQWHRHVAAEGTPQEEHAANVNTTVLLGVFVAVVVFVSGAILFTYIYFTRHMTALRQSRIEITAMGDEFRAQRAASLSRLNSYGWVDAEAGVVSIPIEAAKARVIEEYKKQR
jgi:hypothetical protein